ncbi:hypothetical protein FRX31_034292 [Thalictrum thalictroides]|uniref:Uncharacterized protein n=1 Tax=Thalictrum thalictroides TaxID=46969 RepID=A0A7J6UUJ4_THATH|nr:hypothetical protein FRX31_034292 [Thalictrum thalictroides]
MTVQEDMPDSIWLECPSFPGFWQSLHYPNFLYCSSCAMIGHSWEFCRKRKKNSTAAPKEPSTTKEGQAKTASEPNHNTSWRQPKIKHFYRPTGRLVEGEVSGAKDTNGNEIDPQHPSIIAPTRETQNTNVVGVRGAIGVGNAQLGNNHTTSTVCINTFSVLNNIMEDSLEEDIATAKVTDGIKEHHTQTQVEDSPHIEKAIATQHTEVITEATVVKGGKKSNEEEATVAYNDHRGNTNLPSSPSSTQIISLILEEQGNTQNRSLGKDIAEEFVNTEMENLEGEGHEHSQVIPLAIEAPPFCPSRLLTQGDQSESEEEQSEDEDNNSQEEENPYSALVTHSSDSELHSKKPKQIPPFNMCTRSKTNPNGSTKKHCRQC